MSSHSEHTGDARDVVQAGNVSGGIHFHTAGDEHGAAPPRQLPGDPRGFVNRTDELAVLDALVVADDADRQSLCVIAGTAGAGKTSLALHWAHRVREQFPDGQLHVNLRGYDPGEPVPAAEALHRFLAAFGVPSGAIPTDLDAAAAMYRSLLADRRILVLLDNAATVAQVRPLLPGTPHCLTVVTSRSSLSGLSVRDGAHRLTLGTLAEPEAAALVRAVTAGYRREDGEEKLAELAQLCARLPLALRIAAERAAMRPHMHLDELIADLRDESALWDALSVEDEEEAGAVHSVFAWSYRALPADAARMFRLLGLHPGPDLGLGAAAALAGVCTRQARRQLDVLVGASMLEQAVPRRFELHDLLRAYAVDQVQQEELPEERTAALRRVLGWYLHTADAAQRWIRPDEEHVPELMPLDDGVEPLDFTSREEALDWAHQEQDTFLPAVRAAAEAGLDRHAWQLAAVVWNAQAPSVPVAFWLPIGEVGLRSARRLGDEWAQALLLENMGFDAVQAHRTELAREYHEGALALRRGLGDRRGEADSLNALGLVQMRTGDRDGAAEHLGQAIAAFGDLEEDHWQAVARANLAEVHYLAGHLEEAHDGIIAALATHRAAGNGPSIGNTLRILSAIQLEQGDPHQALRAAEEAVELAVELRDHLAEGYWLLALGDAQRALDRLTDALESYQRSAILHRRLGDRSREARAWQGTGQTYQLLHREQDAAGFHRRAAAVHQELGETWLEALALESLGTAVQGQDPHESHQCWTRAFHLIGDDNTPRATQARQRISAMLAGAADGHGTGPE
ncbi:tetratricopeptide repeat protein [Lipingzhangella sp. LS1_29]|uniref:Tetratricopeptide repeat protein n=1 Tax=Lipingzhangella rawalii TaxID=2055835 RepID=A0ABU2H636_9ACTN|nr:tetratricopeptide repeat protein [Lipingzhangella rawalii]MDS1270748.1 tetratricopeptide repeat protein [Lipingzhangella rawalii]